MRALSPARAQFFVANRVGPVLVSIPQAVWHHGRLQQVSVPQKAAVGLGQRSSRWPAKLRKGRLRKSYSYQIILISSATVYRDTREVLGESDARKTVPQIQTEEVSQQ
jgi:hypothetical protein